MLLNNGSEFFFCFVATGGGVEGWDALRQVHQGDQEGNKNDRW